MEANTPQSNKPIIPTAQDVVLPKVGQQLQYPLDYVTQEILKQFVNTAYPVGSIYMNLTNATNPASLLGIGTWVAIERYVVAGYKSGDPDFGTIGATMGETTHTLTTSEIPAHTHAVDYWANPGGTPSIQGANLNASAGTQASQSAGGGASHNNLQPTLVAYVWKRTA